VWIAAVAAVLFSGTIGRWNDAAFLAFGFALWLPNLLLPALLPGGPERDRRFWETYWFKFNAWIGIVAWIGSYFVTHFLFDVLGMRYRFPATWHLESAPSTSVPGSAVRCPAWRARRPPPACSG
jgi:cycloeucalenol cycloisomerase